MKTMYVYILECNDDSYYTGVTNDLDLRVKQHNENNDIDSYTFSRRPVKLVYYELFNDSLSAINFEKKIKGWTRAKKEALIAKDYEKLKLLSKKKFK
jgi:putative endonuclease